MKKLLTASLLISALAVGTYSFASAGHSHDSKHAVQEFVAKEKVVKESAVVLELLKLKETDHYEGDVNAPIKVVEYASMTCGHCANFHNDYYHEIKEKFVDTGKVLFIFRPLPWDNRALAVSMIAECAPKKEYFNFLSAFMSTHKNWSHSEDFIGSIKQISRLGGMAPDAVDACMKDERANDVVRKSYAEAVGPLGIKGTPTFFVNGERLRGVMNTEELAKMVQKIESEAK